MKPISTQQSEELVQTTSYRDDLMYYFRQECETRGFAYLRMQAAVPSVSGTGLTIDTLDTFLARLAFNPSLVTLFSSENPLDVISEIIKGNFTDAQIAFINDFLDDISINVRMRSTELYEERLNTLKKQIMDSLSRQVGLERQQKRIQEAIEACSHNLLAFYYLRKIGYLNAATKTV